MCDSCRLTLALDAQLADAAATGHIVIKSDDSTEGRWSQGLMSVGSMALAASLALILLLPPGVTPFGSFLGDSGTMIVTPVEGEILTDATPQVTWQPVEEATAYRVALNGLDSSYQWSARVEGTSIEIPADHALTDQGRFRLLVEPLPSDLAPLGENSVVFQRGGTGDLMWWRIQHAPRPILWLALLSGALIATGLTLRRRRSAASI